ncbi:uncharacterized protein LOC134267031 isoform X2 [Saccostrea cucullata]|uniref:uncharacterized protein LOC134267031 isoform X2 n=1 Tax=Saccostrea cuccullata TaxID=36930 RepID=UPI002ED2ACA8
MPPRKYRKSNSPYARPAPAIATSSAPPQATGTVTTQSHAPTIDVVTSSPAPVPPTDATRITQNLVQDTAALVNSPLVNNITTSIVAVESSGVDLLF